MKNTRLRFILAQSLNILAYLLIIISTFYFSNYEVYWVDFLFGTSYGLYGLCITFANICATAALIIGLLFTEKREKRFLYKLSWFYFVAVGAEIIITLPTMFFTVINLAVGVAIIIAAVLQFMAGFLINNYSGKNF